MLSAIRVNYFQEVKLSIGIEKMTIFNAGVINVTDSCANHNFGYWSRHQNSASLLVWDQLWDVMVHEIQNEE